MFAVWSAARSRTISSCWAFSLFRAKLARVVLGAEDSSANSGLGPASQDVVEQSVAQGEFSRIADRVET